MKNLLLKNTIYLYVLTFSTQLLNLVTIPYQTRVFGPEIYGVVGFAVSIMSYVQLTLDFGFILSGTESVSNNRDDNLHLSKIFTIITLYKLLIGIIIVILLTVACSIIPMLKDMSLLVFLYSIAYWINSLLPDYIYRGLEEMKYISIRTVIIKVFFTLLIYLTIKTQSDYIYLPILLIIGNTLAVLFSWYNIRSTFGIKFSKFNKELLIREIYKSLPFFVSRISSTFYQSANTMILGVYFNGQNVVGYYSSADKIVSLSKSISSPIADSLYPYMLKNKNYALIKKILACYFFASLIIAPVIFLNATKISVLLFGSGYEAVGTIIKCLLPTFFIILPTYIICFPVLNPLGLSKYANLSNVIGAVLQIAILVVLMLTNNLNVYSICISSSFTECTVFIYRASIWYIYSRRNKILC